LILFTFHSNFHFTSGFATIFFLRFLREICIVDEEEEGSDDANKKKREEEGESEGEATHASSSYEQSAR